MKKLLYIIALGCTISACKAQEIFPLGTSVLDWPDNNYYVKDISNELTQLEGEWLWTDGSSSFEVTLEKFEMVVDPIHNDVFHDALNGKYKYTVNGVTISEKTTILPGLGNGFSLHYTNPTTYEVVIKDVASNRSRIGKFILTSPTEAEVSFYTSEGVKIYTNYTGEWSLPTEMTLTKQ
ncbi:DUF6705 family protein [Dokdonia sp. LLG6352-1]|uniref:DUF6705 family protein n=1 Tax=Dokdonia sp. LLG6352-1 TaxID=3160831 RepID=UPI00386664CA